MKPTTSTISSTAPAVEALVLKEEENGVVTLTLNRPKQFNALSEAMLAALQKELESIAENDADRLVILQGAGKVFCAGHDLKEMIATRKETYYQTLFKQCSKMMLTLNRIPQPVIARVHGIATAAGCQLVAACDLAVAADDTRFATSGINVGLFCSTPAVPVSRNISRKQAMELLLTGEFIGAETALSWGLINRTVPLEKLDDEVKVLADSILAKSSVAVSTGKKMFYKQLELSMEEAYNYAGEIMACNMMTEDVSEGVDAFINKRKAVWKGR
ncbi:MAG: enoyl-CoA hydratase [SAR324 cluster bacterium]|nr:enoyl-CoA hydratase [SAR324 cluster bacterium]MBL7034849.1 enoyl-CoA hydratase [SAR324 cluster bacterium]